MVIVMSVVALAWVWSIADVIATDFGDEAQAKGLWIATVMVVPVVGALVWMLYGRPIHTRSADGDLRVRLPFCRVIGPSPAMAPGSRGNAWWVYE